MIEDKLNIEKSGFTLAEILIALTVIGVIAALTIPNLVFSVQKHEYATRLEKFFSTMNNGFKMIMVQKGCSDIPCTNVIRINTDTSMTNIRNTNVFNIIESCTLYGTGCHDVPIYTLDNVKYDWTIDEDYALFVTGDGMVWGILGITADCTTDNGSGALNNSCITYGIVDVNGEKAPNIMGRDIFRFHLVSDGRVIPVGTDNETRFSTWWSNSSSGACATNRSGTSCAARIAQEGWEMKY